MLRYRTRRAVGCEPTCGSAIHFPAQLVPYLCGAAGHCARRGGDTGSRAKPRRGRAAGAQPHPNLTASDQKNGPTLLASPAAAEPLMRCSAFRYSSPS